MQKNINVIIASLLILFLSILLQPFHGVAFAAMRMEQTLGSPKLPNISISSTKGHSLPSRDKLVELTKWIVLQTGWKMQSLPKIRIISKAKMRALFLGPAAPHGPLTVEGIYIKRHRVIYLLDSWSPKRLDDLSILVHELVHHLQFLNKVSVSCSAELNIKAYALQFKWLRKQGIKNPKQYLGIDDFTIWSISRCFDP